MSAEPTGTTAEPLDPAHAARALELANDREQVFELMLRAVRSRARFAALLSVHADHIRGRRALADKFFDVSQVRNVRIERNTVRALEDAVTTRAPSIGSIATGEPFIDGMLEALGGLAPSTLVMPVTIAQRTVALLVAHRGADPLGVQDVEDLFPLVAAGNTAMARVLAGRSNAVRADRKTAPPPVRDVTQTDGYDVLEVQVDRAGQLRAMVAEHRREQMWSELAATIRELVRCGMETGNPDEDEQLDLLIELGTIEAQHLLRPDRAIEAWRSAQSIDAANPRILDALEGLFVAQGRWSECVESLEKRVALADGKRAKVAALLNLAAMADERLDDTDRAREAYERVLQLDPQNAAASRGLGEIYAASQQWEPLVALLLERDDLAALEQVARIYEEHIGDARAAFLVWLTVLRRDETPMLLVEHLDRLAPLADAWRELAAETEQLADALSARHPDASAALYHLLGRWQRDRLANNDAAIMMLTRSLQLAPADVDTLYELLELLRANARWTDLAELLRERAEHEQAAGPRSELYTELGDVYETRLGQPHEAITYYERALADEPDSQTALVALHRCYLATEAWPQLGELLPRLIEVLAPSAPHSVIVELYVELGNVLAEHLGRPCEAVEAFREALAIDPTHAPALEGIATTGEAEALLDATETSIDAAPREEQLKRYPDIASAWHEHGRFERAIAAWHKLLALDNKSVATHQGLVRSLRAAKQWGPLVVAMHMLQKVIDDPHERMALLVELANVFENPLRDLDGATAAYREILNIAPHHHGALDALARLYDNAGRSQQALELLTRMLDAITDAKPRAELLTRIGHVHLGVRDAVNARLAFVQALALDIDNPRAREGMARAHLQQGELVAAGEELQRAAQLSKERADVIRCLIEAAWLYLHRLDDTTRARECLQRVLELDPDHADAKQGLAELLSKTHEWEKLWPHLEQELARVAADPDAPDRLDVYVRAARCAIELDKHADALELFERALAIDPSAALQLERADALYRAKDLDGAAAAYQALLSDGTLERAQLVDVYRRLAAIFTARGTPKQALAYHNKILDLDPNHAPTLADLVELQLAQGFVDEAVGTLRTLAAQAQPAERVQYLERIGDLYRDKLQSRPKAMSTYLDALEHDPANRRVLQRLLDLQTEASQWQPAVETIRRFLEHETDPVRRGAYFLASAEIRRNELGDIAGALEHYEGALDELFRAPPSEGTRARGGDAFRAIVEITVAQENYKYLEQAYRRMIKRLAKDDPLLPTLWHRLGDVYRQYLDHTQSAIEAYEVAHALDPQRSPQRARLLAELYAKIGAQQPTHTSLRAAKLVADDPTNPDAYRAVGRTAFEAGRIDEAWCVARALVFLKQANSQEQALYREHQTQEARKATGIIDDDAWALVRHPDESQTLGSIFALIWEAVAASKGGLPKSFELKSKERMPVEHDTRVVAKIFRHAARLVNVPLPDVYIQPRRSGRLMLANVVDKAGRLTPTIIVGRDLMTGYRDTELAAAVGAMLALLRPAYYLKLACPTSEELAAALAAAAHVAGVPNPRPELQEQVEALAPQIQARLTSATGPALRALVARLTSPIDLTKWRIAVDAAAQRAGLLVGGELAAAARMLASDQSIVAGMRPNQRVQDLVAYSVSPNYFQIRQHLGVAIAT